MNAASNPGRSERGLTAWILLFGFLATAAGHGVFLLAQLTRHRAVPNFEYLLKALGTTGTAVLCWFMLCIPLAALALFARRWLQRQSWLGAATLGAAIGSVGAFVYYALMMARA